MDRLIRPLIRDWFPILLQMIFLYLMHMLQIRLMRHLQRMGAIFIRMYRYSLKQTKMDIMC